MFTIKKTISISLLLITLFLIQNNCAMDYCSSTKLLEKLITFDSKKDRIGAILENKDDPDYINIFIGRFLDGAILDSKGYRSELFRAFENIQQYKELKKILVVNNLTLEMKIFKYLKQEFERTLKN